MGLFDLKGRVALVTGGNGGIGFGIASGLAQAGAAVAVAGRDATKTEAAARLLEAHGNPVMTLLADVTDAAACVHLVEQAVRRFGRLDILVNNAGVTARKLPQDITPDEWHRVLDTNLTSAFLCAQAAYPAMKRSGGGKIINTGSMMSLFGASFAAAYGASKGGLLQLTRSLAVAWAPDNIQVNCVLPGWIDTAMARGARTEVPGLSDRVVARTPAGRWGRPEDHAGVAVFLASTASDFVTGAAIPVDGGYSIQG